MLKIRTFLKPGGFHVHHFHDYADIAHEIRISEQVQQIVDYKGQYDECRKLEAYVYPVQVERKLHQYVKCGNQNHEDEEMVRCKHRNGQYRNQYCSREYGFRAFCAAVDDYQLQHQKQQDKQGEYE